MKTVGGVIDSILEPNGVMAKAAYGRAITLLSTVALLEYGSAERKRVGDELVGILDVFLERFIGMPEFDRLQDFHTDAVFHRLFDKAWGDFRGGS